VTKLLDVLKNLLQSEYTRWIVAAVVAIGVVIAAYAFGWLGALLGTWWFWLLLALLIAGGIVAGVVWGVPWLREWRFARHEEPAYVAAGEESPEELQAKFLRALQTLKGLPQLKGKGDPLYALPWYLLIGATGSGKTAALQAADLFSPLTPAPKTGATQNCDWWVSNATLVLDTAGRYALPVDKARDRAEWYRLLRFLRRHRNRGPVDGLVITIGADALVSKPEEALRAEATGLRERIEEAVRELGSDFPVYLLVTKCDLIEGFREFFDQLPLRVLDEAVGYIIEATAPESRDASSGPRGARAVATLTAGLQEVYDRLHLFRLAILDGKAPEGLRHRVFGFPEQLRGLSRSLAGFADTLISEDVRYHTPYLRGVFFSSAQQHGTALSPLRRQLQLPDEPIPLEGNTHYFLHDFFNFILPRDRSLAAVTVHAQRWRSLGRGFVLLAGAAVAFVLAGLVVREIVIDRRIVAAIDQTRCALDTRQHAPGSARLDGVDACREVVETLIDRNLRRRPWLALGLDRSGRLETDLRQRYVQKFKAEVLAPLNGEIDRALRTTGDPLPLLLVLARRVQLDRRCVAPGGCGGATIEDLQPDYQLLLSPLGDRKPSALEVARLHRLYADYLLWQVEPKEELRQDVVDDSKRLQRSLSAADFSVDRLFQWVNRRAAPVTYDQYWELPATIAAVGAAQVDGGCTRKVWERDVAPLLQEIQDAVVEAGPRLRAFREQYRSVCLPQWQRFLAGFTQGTERWRGSERRRTLALHLLTEESPYRRVAEAAFTNLAPWLPAPGEVPPAPQWADRLRQYLGSDQRKTYEDTLTKIGKQLESEAMPEASFNLAKEAFAQSDKPAESTNPVLQAWSLANQIAPVSEDGQEHEDVLGTLVRDPVSYVWRVILDQAGVHLQRSWAEKVVVPLKGLPPAEQVAALYGPGGKVASFVDQYAGPFVKVAEKGAEPQPVVLLGEKAPLAPRFFDTLATAERLKPTLAGGGGPVPIGVRAGRRSDVDGRSTLLEEETVLSISCASKTYRVTNRPRGPGEGTATVLWSYQSCGDVGITIYFPRHGLTPGVTATESGGRLELAKRYTGQTAFLHFLQDFSGGSHRFPMSDFSDTSPEAWRVMRNTVTAVTAYYQVDVPPALARLVSALREAGPPGDIIS
jgi:type VI secretion system protein ImpL